MLTLCNEQKITYIVLKMLGGDFDGVTKKIVIGCRMFTHHRGAELSDIGMMPRGHRQVMPASPLAKATAATLRVF